MAVKQIGPETGNDPQEYIGLSTDVKPTNGVLPGAYFYELNTKAEFMFDGTTWYLM